VVNYDLPQVPGDFIHRVGRTGRAGAWGTASTFSTRSERGEIRRIERELNVRLTPREVAADLPREEKPAANVIPLRVGSPKRAGSQFALNRRKAAWR
jgi:ATP-dependent RNA helicase RhlE